MAERAAIFIKVNEDGVIHETIRGSGFVVDPKEGWTQVDLEDPLVLYTLDTTNQRKIYKCPKTKCLKFKPLVHLDVENKEDHVSVHVRLDDGKYSKPVQLTLNDKEVTLDLDEELKLTSTSMNIIRIKIITEEVYVPHDPVTVKVGNNGKDNRV